MLSLFLSMLETDEERQSFAAFYEEHRCRCLRVAFAITRNYAWAEEAVHDAFSRMIRHKEKYFSDPGKRTGTQIVIMVKGSALNLLKREKRLSYELLEDAELTIPNDEPDAFRIVAGKETVARLKHHVSQLNAVDKAVYQMKYILGKTNGEIAEAIGISKNAVALRNHKLSMRLLGALREEGYVDD